MGRTAYSSANRAYPFLQEESEPSEEEMQGRRDSNPAYGFSAREKATAFDFKKSWRGRRRSVWGLAAAVSVTRSHPGG
jgi:hypothetical protein